MGKEHRRSPDRGLNRDRKPRSYGEKRKTAIMESPKERKGKKGACKYGGIYAIEKNITKDRDQVLGLEKILQMAREAQASYLNFNNDYNRLLSNAISLYKQETFETISSHEGYDTKNSFLKNSSLLKAYLRSTIENKDKALMLAEECLLAANHAACRGDAEEAITLLDQSVTAYQALNVEPHKAYGLIEKKISSMKQ